MLFCEVSCHMIIKEIMLSAVMYTCTNNSYNLQEDLVPIGARLGTKF